MSDLEGKSRDELIAMIKSMEGTAKLSGSDKGWMVTTNNPHYNGKTSGIQFNGGKAFLSPNQYSKEEIDKLITSLQNDFGYKAVETTVDQYYGRHGETGNTAPSVDEQVRAQLGQAPAAEEKQPSPTEVRQPVG